MDAIAINTLTWMGILFCVTQSAMFSGLNLAFFSVSRLRLEVEVATGNRKAAKVLRMREDSNFLLTTILWGNVGINVLLTLLSNSVMAGIAAFFFSTVVITFVGEITPQAYFSRHALHMASMLAPVLKLYQFILYPVAKPVAKVLDSWLGAEGIHYFRERDLREVIKKHMDANETDVERIEGLGALNFLALDDIIVVQEGEPVDPQSVIALPMVNGLPVFPPFDRVPSDPFLCRIQASEKKWVIITDPVGSPRFVLDSDAFLRKTLFDTTLVTPFAYCHRPIIVKDTSLPLGSVILQLKVQPHHELDDVIDHDIILVWGDEKRIITGADILGRLMRGIVTRVAREQS